MMNWFNTGLIGVLVVASLKVTLLIGVAWLLAKLVLRRASAATRHWLWAMALFGCLFIPVYALMGPTIQIPTFENVNMGQADTVMNASQAAVTAETTVSEKASGRSAGVQGEKSDVKPTTPVGGFTERTRYDGLENVIGLGLVSAWLAGALGIAGSRLAQAIRLHSLSNHSAVPVEADWNDLAVTLAQQLNIKRPVRLLYTESVLVPMTWGAWQPIILLPVAAADWPRERWQVVLLHELAHIARWDFVVQWLGVISYALHWFNPLVWLATRELALEREKACDDRVLAAGIGAVDYADHLYVVAQSTVKQARTLYMGVSMTHPSNLEARIRSILNPQQNRSMVARSRRWLYASLSIVTLALLGSLTSRPSAALTNNTSNAMQASSTATPNAASIQQAAEGVILDALRAYGADGGNILIMNPRTGEILAMASADRAGLRVDNPIINQAFEPGAVFQVVTTALALDSGKVTESSTYLEDSPSRMIGGATIYNRDRRSHGRQTLAEAFLRSSNLGAMWMSVDVLGRDAFYAGLRKFGVGLSTGTDLAGEVFGTLPVPGYSVYWSESNLATHSFGQELSVTPLQMLTYINAIANQGAIMKPYVSTAQQGSVTPSVRYRPVSPATAARMTDLMVRYMAEGSAPQDIAGVFATVGVRCVTCTNGIAPTLKKAAVLVGFLPASDPQFSVLIKLDDVTGEASDTVVPTLATLVPVLGKLATP